MNFKDVKVLVLGYGISGKAVAEFLKKQDATIYVYDDKDIDVSPYLLYDCNIFYDYVIISPSIKENHTVLHKCRIKGSVVYSELELAYLINKEFQYNNKIIGITGTNGKTTVTKMIDNVLKASDNNSCAVGNIGYPFINKALEDFTAVCELSSFQLQNLKHFHLDYALLLNIDSDHLDHHSSLSEYVNAKINILSLQNKSDTAILNYDDNMTKNLSNKCKGKVYYFSYGQILNKGTYVDNGIIYFADNIIEKVCKLSDLNIMQKHNVMNALAVICVCKLLKISNELIIETLSKYTYEAFRLQFVDEIDKVKIYNDSKSTNIHSTESAINSVIGNTILILGGHNKNLEYDCFFEKLDKKIKYILCCGENSLDIYSSAVKYNFSNIFIFDTYKDCIEWSFLNKDGIDNILFSPSTSSFDRFINYEQRGDYFNEIITEFKTSQKK